jgi:hypothetical protein
MVPSKTWYTMDGYTIILNHSQEWDGKPTGSHGDSRVAEISRRYQAPVFLYLACVPVAMMISPGRGNVAGSTGLVQERAARARAADGPSLRSGWHIRHREVYFIERMLCDPCAESLSLFP